MKATNRMKMVDMSQPDLKQASIQKADNKSLFFFCFLLLFALTLYQLISLRTLRNE